MHLLLITKLYNDTIDFLYKIHKNLIWQRKKTKIKHSTFCYEKGEKGVMKRGREVLKMLT